MVLVEPAARYATVVGDRECAGLRVDGFDAQIAAICRSHGATLATRNLRDFHATGVELIDPWRA
jgi:toxin FitB